MLKSDTEDKQLADSTENPDPQVRPWVRFWARMIDYGIFGLLAGVVLQIFYPTILDFSSINLTLLLLTAYVFFESIMLAFCGTTPGKALLRIKLRTDDGTKFNYSGAITRSVRVWWRGEGLGIPLVSLVTNILAYNSLKKNGRTAWDRDGKLVVQHQIIGRWRISAAVIILTVLYLYGAIQFCLPLLSGNSTFKIFCIKNAAEYGNAKAQYELGECYYNGGSKDEDETLKKWRKSAEQPWIFPVQNNLWFGYNRYAGITKDNVEAVKWYRKAAEQGYAKAEYMLGICYANSYGVDGSREDAKGWWRKAAEQGLTEAQYSLGASYYRGKGNSENWVEQAKWYRKAAEQGHIEAQYCLGFCYLKGDGVAKDKADAAKWWRKAAEQGHSEAQSLLGHCYTTAWGVERNEVEAAKWYRLAVKNGSESAPVRLGELNSYIERRKAAETGDAKALYGLGCCYDCGSGIWSDHAEALKFWRKAAEKGYAEAQYRLGECYDNGYPGLTKDKTEAVKWWRKAADQEYAYAERELARCYASGEGVAKDEAEAARWRLKAAAHKEPEQKAL